MSRKDRLGSVFIIICFGEAAALLVVAVAVPVEQAEISLMLLLAGDKMVNEDFGALLAFLGTLPFLNCVSALPAVEEEILFLGVDASELFCT